MNFVYAILIIGGLSVLFILSYYFNNKLKVECDIENICDGCNLESCYRKAKKEE